MRREGRERFPRIRVLAIPTCITARAWRTCRDACRDRYLAISVEVGGGKTFPTFPAHAQPESLRIWQDAHENLLPTSENDNLINWLITGGVILCHMTRSTSVQAKLTKQLPKRMLILNSENLLNSLQGITFEMYICKTLKHALNELKCI